jgi:hypothetical protein
MRVNRSRLVKIPEAIIASYWSTVNRASRFWIHRDGGCIGIIADIVSCPRLPSHRYEAHGERVPHLCDQDQAAYFSYAFRALVILVGAFQPSVTDLARRDLPILSMSP